MKILLFADPHVHVWKKFSIEAETGISKRLLEQRYILEQIIEVIKKRKIGYVGILGDIFHRVGEIPVEALNVVKWFFDSLESLGLGYFLVPGNHDLVKRENPHQYHSILNIFNSKIPSLNNYKIKVVGFSDIINEKEIEDYDLVLLHKTPIGSKVGNYEFSEGVDWKKLAKQNGLVCFGHIHQRQQLSDNCFILGSPMPLSFADIGDRGVHILDTVTNKLEFVKLDYKEFKTVNNIGEVKKDGNYYRVLNGSKQILEENVIVNVIKPKYYEERIKGNNLYEICEEWLKIQNKDITYLEVIKDIIQEKNVSFRKIFKGKIKKVQIKNFISIENIKYEVKNGFTLVKGVNGSGKTNLFDAIYYCFFGRTTKELTNDEVIRWGQKDCEVTVYLEGSNGGMGKIVRTSKDGLHIYKNINDKEPITQGLLKDKRQERLEILLGINEEIFLSSCYFSQENLQMLTQLSDTDKTNIINSLLGFDMYCSLYDKCFSNIKGREIDIDFILRELTEIDKKEWLNNSRLVDLDIEKENYNKMQSKSENLVITLKKEIENLSSRLKPVLNQKYIEELLNKILSYSEKEKCLNKLLDECKKEIVEKDLQNKYNNISSEISKWETLIEEEEKKEISLVKEILKIEKAEIGAICSNCGALITEEHITKYVEEKKKLIEEYQKKRSGLKIDLLCKNEVKSTIIEEIHSLDKKEKDIFEQLKGNRNNQKEAMSLKEDYDTKQKELESFESQIKKEIELKKGQIKNEEQHIEEVKKLILEIEKNRLKLEEEKGNIEYIKLTKKKEIEGKNLEIEKLEFWKEAFSPRGIKSLLLGRFCNEFNIILTEYISSVFNNNMSVSLSPTKTIKSGEERNEMSLNVNMLKEGKEINCSYKSLSGGQKRRVDVSLCLSLNKWVSDRYGVPNGLLGLVILDEIFSFLDKEGEESLANLISSESGNKAILVVSHTPSLESFASNVWEMKMGNNVSKLNF